MFEDEKLEIITAESANDLKVKFENWVKTAKPNQISERYFSHNEGKFHLAIFYFL